MMKKFHGKLRIAFLCYFYSHIPITILIDSQAIANQYHPYFYQFLVQWYSSTEFANDILMNPTSSNNRSWFTSIVVFELLFQFPFFFIAIQQLHNNKITVEEDYDYYPIWFKTLCIIYGTHTSTTLIPILGTFVTTNEMTTYQKCLTITIYLPYLIFPSMLLYFATKDDFIISISTTTTTTRSSSATTTTKLNNTNKEKTK